MDAMIATLLALVLLAQDRDPTADEQASVVPAPAVVPAPPPSAPPRSDGWRQGFGVGWHGTTFWNRESSHYTFHSLALGYIASRGARNGLLLHVSALVPLQAREDGRVYATHEVYGTRFGTDLLIGRQWRWRPAPRVEWEAGPGVHGTLLWLPGRPGYRDFSALLLGLGGETIVRWKPGARMRGMPMSLGSFASAAVDFYDPLRSNDLRGGLTFRAGMFAGFGFAAD